MQDIYIDVVCFENFNTLLIQENFVDLKKKPFGFSFLSQGMFCRKYLVTFGFAACATHILLSYLTINDMYNSQNRSLNNVCHEIIVSSHLNLNVLRNILGLNEFLLHELLLK